MNDFSKYEFEFFLLFFCQIPMIFVMASGTQNADFSTVCLFTVTHDHTAKQQSDDQISHRCGS